MKPEWAKAALAASYASSSGGELGASEMGKSEELTGEALKGLRASLLSYGFALAGIAFATFVRILLDPLLGDHTRYATFILVILLTAWRGGRRPALLALILGIFSTVYFLIPPRG